MELRRNSFAPGSQIASRHSCEGEDLSPPLDWWAVPGDAVSLAQILDDPGAPAATFTHWLAWGVAPETGLAEGERPPGGGRNDFGPVGFWGPCPARGHGTHRYFFHPYALDRQLARRFEADRGELERAMDGCVLEGAELVGAFPR
jgi:Raf kinase inhibitor-like YbhB/YbcL family protein